MSKSLTVPLDEQDAKAVEWALAALLADWKQARDDSARKDARIERLTEALVMAIDAGLPGFVEAKAREALCSVGRVP